MPAKGYRKNARTLAANPLPAGAMPNNAPPPGTRVTFETRSEQIPVDEPDDEVTAVEFHDKPWRLQVFKDGAWCYKGDTDSFWTEGDVSDRFGDGDYRMAPYTDHTKRRVHDHLMVPYKIRASDRVTLSLPDPHPAPPPNPSAAAQPAWMEQIMQMEAQRRADEAEQRREQRQREFDRREEERAERKERREMMNTLITQGVTVLTTAVGALPAFLQSRQNPEPSGRDPNQDMLKFVMALAQDRGREKKDVTEMAMEAAIQAQALRTIREMHRPDEDEDDDIMAHVAKLAPMFMPNRQQAPGQPAPAPAEMFDAMLHQPALLKAAIINNPTQTKAALRALLADEDVQRVLNADESETPEPEGRGGRPRRVRAA